jgi:hypothetical protein
MSSIFEHLIELANNDLRYDFDLYLGDNKDNILIGDYYDFIDLLDMLLIHKNMKYYYLKKLHKIIKSYFHKDRNIYYEYCQIFEYLFQENIFFSIIDYELNNDDLIDIIKIWTDFLHTNFVTITEINKDRGFLDLFDDFPLLDYKVFVNNFKNTIIYAFVHEKKFIVDFIKKYGDISNILDEIEPHIMISNGLYDDSIKSFIDIFDSKLEEEEDIFVFKNYFVESIIFYLRKINKGKYALKILDYIYEKMCEYYEDINCNKSNLYKYFKELFNDFLILGNTDYLLIEYFDDSIYHIDVFDGNFYDKVRIDDDIVCYSDDDFKIIKKNKDNMECFEKLFSININDISSLSKEYAEFILKKYKTKKIKFPKILDFDIETLKYMIQYDFYQKYIWNKIEKKDFSNKFENNLFLCEYFSEKLSKIDIRNGMKFYHIFYTGEYLKMDEDNFNQYILNIASNNYISYELLINILEKRKIEIDFNEFNKNIKLLTIDDIDFSNYRICVISLFLIFDKYNHSRKFSEYIKNKRVRFFDYNDMFKSHHYILYYLRKYYQKKIKSPSINHKYFKWTHNHISDKYDYCCNQMYFEKHFRSHHTRKELILFRHQKRLSKKSKNNSN